MEIFEELNINEGLSLAFGFFDGIHLGHRAVIKSAVDFAKNNNTKSAVITFQDHPCCFFYNIKPQYIIRKHDKIKILGELGVDYLYFLKFDDYFANMNGSEYLKNVIVENFAPKAISTGFNHFFGSQKTGDIKLLRAMQKDFGYTYFEVPSVMYENEIISSTRIRENLILGNFELVNSMLGYEYFLEETVVEGQHLGEKIGFRTANLNYPENLVEVGRGVYKVKVKYDKKIYNGIANYGLHPTVGENFRPVLEVHIFDFDKEIYGEKIKVTFLKKIRDEKKFKSIEELKTQIKQDIIKAQK